MVDTVRSVLLKNVAAVEEGYSLAQFNPLKVGGVADYFTEANDAVQLASAVSAALDAKLPYLVIGNGESILFSDGGFPGLVIHNKTSHYALANDRSQMVVDSGMSLRHFITLTASRGFGGLTHLYSLGGTIGGALYTNAGKEEQSILSLVRYVTLIMPPTKLRNQPTIVRYKSDWLERDEEGTKLQWMKKQQPLAPQPVILNAQIQLTSVRSDELLRRITKEAAEVEDQTPSGPAFGPLFQDVPNVKLEELLWGAKATSLRHESMYLDRQYPNYVRSRGRGARAEHVVGLIHAVQEKVRAQYAVELVPRIELLGVW